MLALPNAPPLNVGAPKVGVAPPSLFMFTVNSLLTVADLEPFEFCDHATTLNVSLYFFVPN